MASWMTRAGLGLWALGGVVACEYEEVSYLSDADMTIVAPPDVAMNGGPEDVESSTSAVGLGCESNDECDDGQLCMTSQVLATLRQPEEGAAPIEIPGGFCTVFPCSDDAACGSAGACISGALFDPGAASLSICLGTCSKLSDCRWQEQWSCFDPNSLGIEAPNVCLPDELVVMAECPEGECGEER